MPNEQRTEEGSPVVKHVASSANELKVGVQPLGDYSNTSAIVKGGGVTPYLQTPTSRTFTSGSTYTRRGLFPAYNNQYLFSNTGNTRWLRLNSSTSIGGILSVLGGYQAHTITALPTDGLVHELQLVVTSTTEIEIYVDGSLHDTITRSNAISTEVDIWESRPSEGNAQTLSYLSFERGNVKDEWSFTEGAGEYSINLGSGEEPIQLVPTVAGDFSSMWGSITNVASKNLTEGFTYIHNTDSNCDAETGWIFTDTGASYSSERVYEGESAIKMAETLNNKGVESVRFHVDAGVEYTVSLKINSTVTSGNSFLLRLYDGNGTLVGSSAFSPAGDGTWKDWSLTTTPLVTGDGAYIRIYKNGGNATTGQEWFIDKIECKSSLRNPIFPSEPTSATTGDYWTMAVIPDTHVEETLTGTWYADQTATADWLVANKEKENIQMVIHQGDMLDAFPIDIDADVDTQAQNALNIYGRIDDSDIPFLICLGSHDYYSENKTAGLTPLTSYFPSTRYTGKSWYGGSMSSAVSNVFYTQIIFGRKYLFLALNYDPDQTEIDWAKSVLDAHPNHTTIIVTHSYINNFGGYISTASTEVRDQLCHAYKNVNLVVCGHDHDDFAVSFRRRRAGGTGFLETKGTVPEHKATPHIALFRIYESENRVEIVDFIPTTGASLTEEAKWNDGKAYRDIVVSNPAGSLHNGSEVTYKGLTFSQLQADQTDTTSLTRTRLDAQGNVVAYIERPDNTADPILEKFLGN